MCTAVSWKAKHHYFGRNLDLEYGLEEQICITPRRFTFRFRHKLAQDSHYAMIGTAFVTEEYPLYFDATNEMGLSMAGLNFPHNAVYHSLDAKKDNIASFELIPWILGQCKNVSEAEKLLENIQIVSDAFREDLPPTPLHWIISDATKSIVLESMADGQRIHPNPVGVLTNNPPFDFHLLHLANYRHLSPEQSENHFSSKLDLSPYSNGMGGLGLPGDFSSTSRFIKAAFVKENSIGGTVQQDITQFFHILDSVSMPRGSVRMQDGRYEITRYSSCCDTISGIYYYKTYEGYHIRCVNLHAADLDSRHLVCYPMSHTANFHPQNETGGSP